MTLRQALRGPRRRLVRDLLLLLALTAGVLLLAVSLAGQSVGAELACQQLEALANKTFQELAGFFRPVEQTLRMARGWGRTGDLDLASRRALVARFIPVLAQVPEGSALVPGDSDGRSLHLTRDGKAWVSRALDGAGHARWRLWSGPDSPIGESQGAR
jgi:hypothetical protein